MNLFSDRPSGVRPLCEQPHLIMQYLLPFPDPPPPDRYLLVNRSISVDQSGATECQITNPPIVMNL